MHKPMRQEIVRRILGVYPEAELILLYGSRARNEAHVDSDYDLIVVVESELPPALRAAKLHLALRGLGAAFDVLVPTPREYKKNLRWQSSVVFTAASEGTILYEAA